MTFAGLAQSWLARFLLLAAIAVYGWSMISLAAGSPASAAYEYGKTTICHNGQTIVVSNNAVPAHQRHGDTVGPCPGDTK